MWTVTLSITDSKNKTSTTELHFGASATLANVEAFLNTMLPTVNAIIGGVISGVNIVRNFALPAGLKTVPDVDADVEKKLKVLMTTVGGWATNLALPTVRETMIVDGSSAADSANANISAFVAQLEAGILGVTPTDGRGDDIVLVKEMYKQFNSSTGSR